MITYGRKHRDCICNRHRAAWYAEFPRGGAWRRCAVILGTVFDSVRVGIAVIIVGICVGRPVLERSDPRKDGDNVRDADRAIASSGQCGERRHGHIAEVPWIQRVALAAEGMTRPHLLDVGAAAVVIIVIARVSTDRRSVSRENSWMQRAGAAIDSRSCALTAC